MVETTVISLGCGSADVGEGAAPRLRRSVRAHFGCGIAVGHECYDETARNGQSAPLAGAVFRPSRSSILGRQQREKIDCYPMCFTTASPNSLHFTSWAAGIMRAKS